LPAMEVLLKTVHPLGRPTSRFLLQASLRKSTSCFNFHSIPSPYLGLELLSRTTAESGKPTGKTMPTCSSVSKVWLHVAVGIGPVPSPCAFDDFTHLREPRPPTELLANLVACRNENGGIACTARPGVRANRS